MSASFLLLGGVETATAPSAPTTPGHVRVVSRRFQTEAGWWAWRGIADFAAVGDVLKGQADAVARRFDVYQRAKRTIVRTMAMLGEQVWVNAGLAFSPRTPGYWEALEAVYQLAAARGMNLELCLFADAQVVVPDAQERARWMQSFADFLIPRPSIVPQLANEPFKNGWSNATDPALLGLAEILAGRLGHRDFSIGDPAGEQGEGGGVVADALIVLAGGSAITVVHPDRSQRGDQIRWRRWIDHMEGFTDVASRYQAALVMDEPMGAGPSYLEGRRDNDPDAFVAAQMTALCCGFGFTYHWIVEEWASAEQLPGLLAMAPWIDRVPVSSDWSYRNDSWPGSPTHGYKVLGKDGKVRSMTNGAQFWTVAEGELDFGSINWIRHPTDLVYDGVRCKVWRG